MDRFAHAVPRRQASSETTIVKSAVPRKMTFPIVATKGL